MTVSDEAVEAAIAAVETVTPPPGVSKSDWLKKHGRYALLAGAIEAAAPFIAAQAWEEGMRAGKSRAMRHMSDEPGLSLNIPNPYRSEQ